MKLAIVEFNDGLPIYRQPFALQLGEAHPPAAVEASAVGPVMLEQAYERPSRLVPCLSPVFLLQVHRIKNAGANPLPRVVRYFDPGGQDAAVHVLHILPGHLDIYRRLGWHAGVGFTQDKHPVVYGAPDRAIAD